MNNSGAVTLFHLLAFGKKPRNETVVVGEEVVFLCQFTGADAIRWKLNNTLQGEQNITDKNISIQTALEEGVYVHTLKITAHKSYNKTTVQCLAIFFSSNQSIESPIVTLLIQGKLLMHVVGCHVMSSS